MAKICIECGKKKGLFDYNYAGYQLKKSYLYPFPERISEIDLPGDKKLEYLCLNCANKRKINCEEHGVLGNFHAGRGPKCLKCEKEKKYHVRFIHAYERGQVCS